MTLPDRGKPSGPADLLSEIEQARTLLRAHGARCLRSDSVEIVADPLPSLLEQARALLPGEPEPIRTLHHFACTGGSLFSKVLAAGPNVRLLSEVDPLSRHMIDPANPTFAPTDLIRQLHHSFRDIDDERIVEVFLGGLEVLVRQCRTHGERLILRDHSHSHYCRGNAVPRRPTLNALAARVAPALGAVTVRDPMQSWIALSKAGWIHFAPRTLEEYAVRYHAFLDDHEGLPVFRYEDLVASPEEAAARLCDALDLPFDPMTLRMLGAVRVTGESGRTGSRIAPRASRTPDAETAEAAAASAEFSRLRERLGYPLSA